MNTLEELDGFLALLNKARFDYDGTESDAITIHILAKELEERASKLRVERRLKNNPFPPLPAINPTSGVMSADELQEKLK